jgi:NifU-like protein involved in Fe-S cluster formation
LFARQAPAAGGAVAGEAGSRERGTWVRFSFDLADGIITNAGFRALACPHIIAACHSVTDMLEGAPLTVIDDLALEDIQRELEIPVEKAGKLLILKDALSACMKAAEAHQTGNGL